MTDLKILRPETEVDLADIQTLCWDYREFLLSLGGHDAEVATMFYPVDAYREVVETLAARHAPPEGDLFLARLAGAPVGCGMFHTLRPGAAEIKRVFVRPQARGHGAGRRLMDHLINACRAARFERIFLDTARPLSTAIALYTALGFKERGPYYDVPEAALPVLRFFEKEL
ncbi:MAG: GNAT family N-acetyltransferase [Pseudomonadota bacterium]